MHDTLSKFSLDGKAVLVTGAAGLLGVQHCLAVAELGALVILTDLNEELLEEAKEKVSSQAKVEPVCLVMDVGDEESVKNAKQMAEQIVLEKEHTLKCLINNAAIDHKVSSAGMSISSRLEDFDPLLWNKEVRVGLTGAILCAKHFGPTLVRSGEGVILNISSDLSLISPDQRLYARTGLSASQQPVKSVSYPIIKTGLIGLTRYLATYWPDSNLRCNALSPGGIYNGQEDEFVSKLSNLIPLGRMAAEDEYRSVVQFMCSDASSYMNGHNVVMDGGRSTL